MTEPQPPDAQRASPARADALLRAAAALSSVVEESGGRVVAVCIDGVLRASAALQTAGRPDAE